MVALLTAIFVLAGAESVMSGGPLPSGRYAPAEIEIAVIREVGPSSPSDTVRILGTGRVELACPDSTATSSIPGNDIEQLVEVFCREDFFSLRPDYTWSYHVSGHEDGCLSIGHIEDTVGHGAITIRIRIGAYEKSVVSFGGASRFAEVLSAIDSLRPLQAWRLAMQAMAVAEASD